MTYKTFMTIGDGLAWVSRQFALTGGLVMLMIALITVTSIIGRSLFGVSVEGDYEITQVGLAISVFAFLPECQLKRSHVVVDFFTMNASDRTITLFDMVSDFIFALVSIIFVWRIYEGGVEAYEYQELTMILEIPLWWAYLAGVISFSFLFLCCLHNGVSKMIKFKQL